MNVFAEANINSWQELVSNRYGLRVYWDSSSTRSDNTYLYYIVRYDDLIKNTSNVVFMSSDCKGNRAAVLESKKYDSQKIYQINNVENYNFVFKPLKQGTTAFLFHNKACSSYGRFHQPQPLAEPQEMDFGPYMRELQRKIKMNWEPPKGNESKKVIAQFRIDRDGRLLSANILQSSGLSSNDEAAIKAINLSAPFKTLPAEYKASFVDIQFTFDYNVFGTSN